MAITTITSGINTEKGISYSAITDSSIDWTGITNDTYFYNLEDDLPYYKNTSGTVLSIFDNGSGVAISGGTYSGGTLTLNDSSGGSVDITGVTSPSIYTSDDTIGSGRIATLTDTLTFKGADLLGASSNIKIVDSASASLWDFRNNGDVYLGKSSTITLPNVSQVLTFDASAINSNILFKGRSGFFKVESSGIAQLAKFESSNNCWVSINSTGVNKNALFLYESQGVYKYYLGYVGDSEPDAFSIYSYVDSNSKFYVNGGGDVILNGIGTTPTTVGSEQISLQGLTLINDYLIQDANTSAIADGTLVNDSFSFHIDGGALAGRYKDNLGVVTDLVIGGPTPDVLGIADSNGVYTYYSDFTTAMGAAVAGDTVEMFGDITETGNVTITIPSGVNLNMNGHTYTLDGSDNTAFQYTNGVGTRTKIINGTIIKKNSPTPLGGGNGLYIGSSPDLIDCNGLTVISDGAYCLNFNSAPDGSGFVKGGSFIYEGATSKAGGYAHIIDGRIDGAFFDTQDGSVRVTNAIFSNCKVDGAIATANTLGEVENCIVKNTNTFNAGIIVQGAKVSNCYVYSQNTDAISSSNASSIISNCTAISDGSEGLNLNLGYAYNCYVKSTVTNGAWINQAGSAAYNCTIESSAAAAVRLRVGGRIYNSTAICTWNDVNGHAITVENSGVHEVIDCYCEVANASAYALTGNLSTIYSGLKGKGMTTLIGTTTQAQTNSTDNFGNMLIG